MASPHPTSPVCSHRLAGHLTGRVRRWLHNPERILGPYVRPGMVVADLGCGPGYFTLPLAAMVGEEGRVIAVDLQPEMLAIVATRAAEAGLASRIDLHPCRADTLGLDTPLDLALLMWMVHETPDPRALLAEVAAALKPGGRALLIEPVGHVRRAAWEQTLALAREAGLVPGQGPRVSLSRAAELGKGVGG